jgi:putative membrane protein
MKFTDQEKAKVAESIKKAESTTSGEIVPLIVRAADPYPHADLIGGTVAALVSLLAAVWIFPIPEYIILIPLMISAFAVGFLLTRFAAPIKRLVIGKEIMEVEVAQRAFQAFFEMGLTRTRDRTGILIMVSLLEHRVQVLADEGINSKVEDGAWDEVVHLILGGVKSGDLTTGLCQGIERCGELLTKNFPIKPDDTNELPNELIVQ